MLNQARTRRSTPSPVAVPTAVRRSSRPHASARPVGQPLTPTEAAAEQVVAELPVELTASVVQPEPSAAEPTLVLPRPCASCGGVVGSDGYCETCGTKAPSERDHYVERPASWVAACCDRGIRHHRNEDATAVAAVRGAGQARRAGGLRRGLDRRRVRHRQHGCGQDGPGRPGVESARRTRRTGESGRRDRGRPGHLGRAGQRGRHRRHLGRHGQSVVVHVRGGGARGRPVRLRQRRRQPRLLDHRPGVRRSRPAHPRRLGRPAADRRRCVEGGGGGGSASARDPEVAGPRLARTSGRPPARCC